MFVFMNKWSPLQSREKRKWMALSVLESEKERKQKRGLIRTSALWQVNRMIALSHHLEPRSAEQVSHWVLLGFSSSDNDDDPWDATGHGKHLKCASTWIWCNFWKAPGTVSILIV
jgi:hypothetical protein